MSFKEISAPNTLAFSSHFFLLQLIFLQFKTQKQNVLKNLVSQKKTRAVKNIIPTCHHLPRWKKASFRPEIFVIS